MPIQWITLFKAVVIACVIMGLLLLAGVTLSHTQRFWIMMGLGVVLLVLGGLEVWR
jgi:general stress protein CsbA